LRNRDIVEGTLAALTHDSIRIEVSRGKEVSLDRNKVSAVALSTTLSRSLVPKTLHGRVILSNGGRWSFVSLRGDSRHVTGKTLFGASVDLPVSEIAGLEIFEGRAVYLSDLRPARYETTPFLDVRWPYALDRSVLEHEIRLGDDAYDKGIGMHSESRLTYDLGGRYTWFEATVGLDRETGQKGSAPIDLLIDGKPQSGAIAGADEDLTWRTPPRPLRLKVSGAKELTLVVKFGRHGDVGDHVNWANARLIK
jgi:hypothetical protein